MGNTFMTWLVNKKQTGRIASLQMCLKPHLRPPNGIFPQIF